MLNGMLPEGVDFEAGADGVWLNARADARSSGVRMIFIRHLEGEFGAGYQSDHEHHSAAAALDQRGRRRGGNRNSDCGTRFKLSVLELAGSPG